MGIVGSSIPHESAYGHVTGQAHYIDDYPQRAGELLVSFFGSPVAHGKIRKLNVEKARALPGVAAVLTRADVPGANIFGPIIADESFLAESEAHFIGDPLAIIAARDLQALNAARKAIELDIEELPPILTVDEAVAAGSFISVERKVERGDFEGAFRSAPRHLTGTFHIGGQEQFYFESQSALALPDEDSQLTIYSSTQNPTEIQTMAARVLGLDFNKISVICKRMGGAFGGKETQGVHAAIAVGLVALKTGRPARCVYDKDTDMRVTGKRHPYVARYRIGFEDDGKILAYAVDFFSNGGCSADLSTSVLERTLLHADNSYFIPNARFTGRICRTNLPSNTAFRGFGGPQGIACVENAIEEIAAVLGKDPFEIRRLNVYSEGERAVTPYGQILRHNTLGRILDELAESSGYFARRKAVREWNAKRRPFDVLKGVALVPVKFGISFTTKFLNQGSALVHIYTDGSLQVSTGGTEMGQGLYTKIGQLVADEFDIPVKLVRVMPTSTERNNNASPTAASAGTDLNGSAAVNACRAIRERLAYFAASEFSSAQLGLIPSPGDIVFEAGYCYDRRRSDVKLAWAELVHKAYRERVSLGERGFYATPGVDFNRETGKGNPFLYYTNGACVAEVEIDPFTGSLKVTELNALMDFGQSINPGIDRGQAIGGIIQGVGWVTNEELCYTAKGELLSHSPTTYKIPNIADMPPKFDCSFLDNPTNDVMVRRSKAVAEPPLVLGLAAFCAVKAALADYGRGKPAVLDLPATNEQINLRMHQIRGGDAAAFRKADPNFEWEAGRELKIARPQG